MLVILFRRWRLMWCYRRFTKNKPITLSKVLLLIHPDLISAYQPLTGMDIALNTNRAHVTQVLEDLEYMRRCVEQGGYVDKKKIDTRRTTTLDDFLTTENEVPLDLTWSVEQITTAYQQYQIAMSKAESQKENYYNRLFNRVESDVKAFVHAVVTFVQQTH